MRFLFSKVGSKFRLVIIDSVKFSFYYINQPPIVVISGSIRPKSLKLGEDIPNTII